MSRIIKVSEETYFTLKKLKKEYNRPMMDIADGLRLCANYRELDDIFASKKSGLKLLGKMR